MSMTGNNVLRAVQTMGLSDLETRIIKSTYDDYDAPKQKHVDSLISYTNEYNIVPLLEKQLNEFKWNIIFKTLVVIHRCTLDGNIKFMNNLCKKQSILNLNDWSDMNGDGRIHIKYIRQYSDYLSSKCDTYRQCTVSLERENPVESKKYINSIDNTTLYKLLPILIYQFDKLLRCYPSDLTQPVAAASMSLLIKDAFRIYSTLTVSFLQILDLFNKLTLDELQLTSQCIERFIEQNSKFKLWSEKLTKLGMIQTKVLPKFDAIPDTFKQLVDEKIMKLESSKQSKKHKKKNKKDKHKKAISSSDSDSDNGMYDKKPSQHESSDNQQSIVPSPKQIINTNNNKKSSSKQQPVVAHTPSSSSDTDSDSEDERQRRKAKKQAKKMKKQQKLLQQQQQQQEYNDDTLKTNNSHNNNTFDLMQSFDPVLSNISNQQQNNQLLQHQRIQSIDPYTQLQHKAQLQMIPYNMQQPQQQPYPLQSYNTYNPSIQSTPPPAYGQPPQQYYTHTQYNNTHTQYQQPSAALGYGVPGNPLPAQHTPGNPDLISRTQPSQQAMDGLFNIPASAPASVPVQPQQQKKIKQNADEMFSDLL